MLCCTHRVLRVFGYLEECLHSSPPSSKETVGSICWVVGEGPIEVRRDMPEELVALESCTLLGMIEEVQVVVGRHLFGVGWSYQRWDPFRLW
jgi:hypothetical protein